MPPTPHPDSAAPRHAFGIAVHSSPAGPGSVLMRVEGEIDLATTPVLSELVGREIDRSPQVVLDLSAVSFCGALGARLLAQLSTDARTAGGELLVTGAGPMVRRVLRICGIDDAVRWLGERASEEAGW